MSRSRLLRLAPVVALLVAACSGGGGPSGPDPDPDPPPPVNSDLTIEWDGANRSWGEPVTLRVALDEGVEGDRIEWVSLEDHYQGALVVLGTGVEMTTQALRPGITTVEARLLDAGGQILASATTEVRVTYRESWRMTQEGLVSFPPNTVADVWVSDGHAYLARISAGGVSIIDLDALAEVGRYTAPTLQTRDVKVADGVAYVSHEPTQANAHPFSVTFLDVSDPRNPVVLGGIPIEDVGGAHNVYVEGSLLAIADHEMFVYDVSDPTAPVELGFLAEGRAHDAHLRNGRLFGSFLPRGAELGGLAIGDVGPGGVTRQSMITYPGSFTHSAWLSADGAILYIADERVNAPIRIYDVSSSTNPLPLGTYQPRLGTIPHNFQVKDDRFAYLAHYKHGVEVVDVSDPAEPRLLGFYDTHPGVANDDLLFAATPASALSGAHEKDEQAVFEGVWGVHWDDTGRIVASDMETGLYVLRYVGP